MTLLAEPLLEPTSTDEDEDLHHTSCCDPYRSICGLDLDGDAEECPEDCDARPCEMCERLADMPCSNPRCPGRRPLRRLRRWLGR